MTQNINPSNLDGQMIGEAVTLKQADGCALLTWLNGKRRGVEASWVPQCKAGGWLFCLLVVVFEVSPLRHVLRLYGKVLLAVGEL